SDGTNIYWTIKNEIRGCQRLAGCGAFGGTDGRIASTLGVARIAVRNGQLYWGDETHDIKTCKVDLVGTPRCEPRTLVQGAGNPRALAVDENAVYWTDDAPNGSLR